MLTPSKKTASDFNNGNKFVDDFSAQDLNNLIEGMLWVQENVHNYLPELVGDTLISVTSDMFGTASQIVEYAFYRRTRLESVELGENIYSIGGSAFQYCTALKTVTIKDGTRGIGNSAFGFDTALETVRIGSNISSIGQYAFSFCTSLKYLYINATTPPTLNNNSLNQNTALVNIFVPADSVDAYKTATNWSVYADIIVANNE